MLSKRFAFAYPASFFLSENLTLRLVSAPFIPQLQQPRFPQSDVLPQPTRTR